MGLFKKRAADTQELEQLKAEIASMASRLDAADASKQQLDQRVAGLSSRLDTPLSPPPEPPPPRVDPADLDLIRARIERLSQQLDEVDARITAISTELANQLSELSGDLDALGTREPPTEQVVDELRDAQERLANEQARYQIAFRQDLAALADRLKRA
jgi:DNA repair exonuclease SbcCD ATPase subunit